MWYVIAAVYVLAAVLTYVCVCRKWDNPTYEKVWFSIFWIALLPLWVIHAVYNAEKNR